MESCSDRQLLYSKFGQTNLQVSTLGLGTAQLALCHGTPMEDEAIATVVESVRSGINYIDTAPFYGQGKSELVLGKALQQIPRNSYYLATKVGRYGAEPGTMFDFSAKRTRESFEESLQRLGVDYIDILQVHDVEFAADTDIILNETLPVLQQLKDFGRIKYIGITGYPLAVLKEILVKSEIKIDMILSYCRCTMFDNSFQTFLPFFQEKELGIVNAAALGMGLLTQAGPPDWHPAQAEIKLTCQQASEYCKERNVDIAKVAADFSFKQPGINVHLIGMQSTNLLKTNLSTLLDGLNKIEKKVQAEILKKYFKNLSFTDWENIEVSKYKESIKKLTAM